MRKMMEGVVMNGTGRNAQLDGYSAAGKTGTAQKIDVRTHTYSKTKYVASFVGFAPVNDPAISVAIVMDSPAAGGHYGADASAPAFRELAQQILEYLGVPHDQELKPQPLIAKNQQPIKEDDRPAESDENLNSLFADVNDLPADDPLRAPQQAPGQAAPVEKDAAPVQVAENIPASVSHTASPAAPPAEMPPPKPADETVQPTQVPASPPHPPDVHGSVIVNASKRVAVPSLVGQSVRDVIEKAGSAGLGVQVLGSGIAREQAPSAGTMVPAGTEIVVRFTR
jgi:cell division protein FtsI (penicillin-binding protein 3)